MATTKRKRKSADAQKSRRRSARTKASTTKRVLTRADIRAEVRRTAQSIAREHGMSLSPEAIRSLVSPSTAYFAENKPERIDKHQLRAALEPLIATAASRARDARNPVRKFRRPSGGREITIEARRNPIVRTTRVGAIHIEAALKDSKCHYLWLC